MSDRPSIPAAIRRKILIDAGHHCAVCGVPEPLEIAHIVPWSKTKAHREEDLICLCASCHQLADTRHWGALTLREYKKTPWIYRNREKQRLEEVSPSERVQVIPVKRFNILPEQPTPLVGRAHELAEICRLLLDGKVRLLSLTGPGGIGKTRLCLQAGTELREGFEHGVLYLDLSSLSRPDHLLVSLAQTLGIRDQGLSPLEAVVQALRLRQMLLIFDGFERVSSAAPQLSQLLSACPWVKFLVGTRVRLRVQAENEFPVPPLALPTAGEKPPVEVLVQYPAIELFLQRVSTVQSDLVLTEQNATAAAEICRRLDGLPLAIELAAARVRIFSLTALLARLENRLSLLTEGKLDAPARQQTLRATIDWSHDLLQEHEKSVFRRLSVLIGGFTLQAAERICASDLGPAEVLSGVGALLDGSLLRAETQADGERRFWMLQTIQEYAQEQLALSGEAAGIRERHARFFEEMVERADLTGAAQATALPQLGLEIENLRAALQWAQGEEGDAEVGLSIAVGLWLFWGMRGLIPEARSHLRGLLSLGQERVSKEARAQALVIAGNLALDQGDLDEAEASYGEALDLGRELENPWRMAGSLNGLGHVAYNRGEDDELAYTLYSQSLEIKLRIQEISGSAVQYVNLAEMALVREDFVGALALLEKSEKIWLEKGDLRSLALYHARRAKVSCLQGDLAEARSSVEESVRIVRSLGDRKSGIRALEACALLASAQGRPEQAVRLLGAIQAARESMGYLRLPRERLEHEKEISSLRENLGERLFEEAWAEGTRMPIEQAFDMALSF